MKTWRFIQLGDNTCDQDRIILNLYKDVPVKYIGNDSEFSKLLKIDNKSKHVVAIFNRPGWLSDFINFVKDLENYESFYLGINRYLILGNDTNIKIDSSIGPGQTLINLVRSTLPQFDIVQSGFFDDDAGKYFNFVQPLTWIYATNRSN